METYNGHVRTPTDAIILFEACRIGLLPRVQRRLSEKERQSIKSGSVFVWDEREAGMRRWTDGKSWSASRVSGSFLTYREMEGKRSGNSVDRSVNRDGVQGQEGDSDGGPDGYRYKPDGLMKQSFSIKTQQGQHLHLISYFSRSSTNAQNLMQPSNDPQLRHIRPEKGMYPDSTVHEQAGMPPSARGPLPSPGYAPTPSQPSPYSHQQSHYGAPPPWAPPSPMHTPPPHSGYSPHYYHAQSQQRHFPAQSPLQPGHYQPSQLPNYGSQPPSTPYDRPPPPMSTGLPPHPSQPYGAPATPNGHPSNYPPPPSQYNHGCSYPPSAQHHERAQFAQSPGYQSHEVRSPHEAYHHAPYSQHQDPYSKAKDERQDSHHNMQQSYFQDHKPQIQPTVQLPATTPGQTIPSISAMLNGGDDTHLHTRAGLQDIPSHKLGFEANRDMQALRNLDKTTFKQY